MKHYTPADIIRYDWPSILAVLIIAVWGIMQIGSVDHYLNPEAGFWQTHQGKQTLWAVMAAVFVMIIVLTPQRFFIRWSSLIYLISLLLLAGVLVAGKEIAGAKSWYVFGGVSFQPSEAAKWMTALGLAKLLSERDFHLRSVRNLLKTALLLGIPVALILLQPDMGTVIVFVLAYVMVLFRFGLNGLMIMIIGWLTLLFLLSLRFSPRHVLAGLVPLMLLVSLVVYFRAPRKFRWRFVSLVAAAGMVSAAWAFGADYLFRTALKPHQQKRIAIMLGKLEDAKGAGYHLRQSLIAISNGGMHGRGYMKGSQLEGRFIPEQHTDYIFTTIAEQFGFVGSTLFIALYLFLILRLLWLAERQKILFAKVFGYSLAAFLAVHLFLNILMTLGLFPTVGIPIPFVSYGGSAFWNFVIFLFLFLHFDAHRDEFLA